jgi:hypothetical protein
MSWHLRFGGAARLGVVVLPRPWVAGQSRQGCRVGDHERGIALEQGGKGQRMVIVLVGEQNGEDLGGRDTSELQAADQRAAG